MRSLFESGVGVWGSARGVGVGDERSGRVVRGGDDGGGSKADEEEEEEEER